MHEVWTGPPQTVK